jgi:2-polyprenyl-3-methyl-5-hydroxy-6-metoxy-1,4-benzoquinol methylase
MIQKVEEREEMAVEAGSEIDSPSSIGGSKLADVIYVHPATGGPLKKVGDEYRSASDSDLVGNAKYASSFSFQWLKTKAVRSLHPELMSCHQEEMDLRTGFASRDLSGMRCLEVGAGLGDDTAYMLTQGIKEIYSVDLSESIYRAAKLIEDPRAHFVRADVNALPFEPGTFDVVICHRMIQHTPHPAATLARAARMVKPGGILFVHSYHKSSYFKRSAKYKYRWLTTRIPRGLVWGGLALLSPILRWTTVKIWKVGGQRGADLAHCWSPWVVQAPHLVAGVDQKTLRQYELQITFDALTPTYDLPMYADDFVDLIEGLGFSIEHIERRPWFPLWATAVRTISV